MTHRETTEFVNDLRATFSELEVPRTAHPLQLLHMVKQP